MQKDILILGLGAFGFAVAKHLGENNPDTLFYASERNQEIFDCIEKTRIHPYFFPGVKLPENIKLVQNKNLELLVPEVDIIIPAIPCQFIADTFETLKDQLKVGITIVNLAKGIHNETLKVASETLKDILTKRDYQYAYLAGGMIAQELIDGNMLGADLVIERPVSQDRSEIPEYLKNIFQSPYLDIQLKIGKTKNTELYAALKNIVALILGYYEGQGAGASTLGYYFTKLLGEVDCIIELLGGESMIFTDYALSGDLIATCFGNSRNRLLGNMLGKGMTIEKALADLKAQKKIAEGYETLKGIYKITQGKEGCEEINNFAKKYI